MKTVVRALRLLPLMGALAVPGIAHADDTIATVTRATPVSAFGGRLVWSSYDPGRRGYVLMSYDGGVVSAVPVAVRSVPFDVDLGPRRDGAPVAVYSRCRRDPPRRRPFIGNALTRMPDWARGRGCDVYRFDFTPGRESRVAGASSRGGSEFLPSIWRTRIVFARVLARRTGIAGRRPHLYRRALGAGARSRRLPAGSRSTARFCSGERRPPRCRQTVEPGPTSLDLGAHRLAFAWDSADDIGPTSAVYVETLTARRAARRRLWVGTSGDIQAQEAVSAQLDTGVVYWGSIEFGDTTANRLLRYLTASRRLEQAPLPPPGALDAFRRPVVATAVDRTTVFYLLSGHAQPAGEPCTPQTPCIADPGCSTAEPCALRRTQDVAFGPAPR